MSLVWQSPKVFTRFRPVFRLFRRGLPRQSADWLAMTPFISSSINSNFYPSTYPLPGVPLQRVSAFSSVQFLLTGCAGSTRVCAKYRSASGPWVISWGWVATSLGSLRSCCTARRHRISSRQVSKMISPGVPSSPSFSSSFSAAHPYTRSLSARISGTPFSMKIAACVLPDSRLRLHISGGAMEK